MATGGNLDAVDNNSTVCLQDLNKISTFLTVLGVERSSIREERIVQNEKGFLVL